MTEPVGIGLASAAIALLGAALRVLRKGDIKFDFRVWRNGPRDQGDKKT